MAAPKKLPTQFKVMTVRIPPELEHRIGAVATRETSSVASTMRRLMLVGLRTEDRERRTDRD